MATSKIDNPNIGWRDITQSGLILPKNQDGFKPITGVSQSTKDEIKAAREVVILTTDNGRAGNYFYFVDVGNHSLSINNYYESPDSDVYFESINMRVDFSTGDISGDYLVGGWGFSAPSIYKIYVR